MQPISLPTLLDLLRHGQVATPDLFCAPSHEPLSATGWQQLTHATATGQWDVVITSPSRRCHEFADALSARLACRLEVDQRLGEMNFGDWTGKAQLELWEQYPALMQQLWYQPLDFVAPHGEAMVDFIARVQRAWADILLKQAGQRVLLLTHAGVIRVVLAQVLGLAYQNSLRFEVGHARFTRIKAYPDGVSSVAGHGMACS